MDALKKKWKKNWEREREREVTFFMRKLCREWKWKCQIYNNILRIRRVKIKEDKMVENEWY